jgi:alkaline phosphatase D
VTAISRRAFLGGLLAAAACSGSDDSSPTTTTAGGATTTAPPPDVSLATDPFQLGVASGDPDDSSVVLWTRLLGVEDDVPVRWDVLDEEGDVVASGEAVAESRWAGSVHVVADGLDAGTTYRYRFRVGAFTSSVGTTRTAPAEGESLSLAVASCQRYDDGHFVAHRDIAAADVDLVVFLGDYIYESAGRPDPVRPLPSFPEAVVDLAGYRARYEAARRDPDLAAAHAAHPWAVTWDDHEVANDSTSADVDAARRAAAYQAWWEHQPVRLPPPEPGAAFDVHRALRWGGLADLLLLDTRQHRAAEVCGGGVVDVSDCPAVAEEARTMLGAAQEAWLLEELGGSTATWTVLGQSVVLAPIQILDLANTDAWDGFPAARARILDALPSDTVVLTGDIHVQLVADVAVDGRVVATELVTPSITSRVSEQLLPLVDTLPVLASNVQHAVARRGWLRCDVTADEWVATYREVLDVADPASEVVDGPAFRVARGTPGAVRR